MSAVVHQLWAAGPDGPTRQLATYRTYALAVMASRGSNGEMVVIASLRGGPERAQYEFRLRSEEGDALAACAAALRELQTLVDQLWLGPIASQTAFGS